MGKDAIVFGAYHDHPKSTPPDKLRYDACITVPKGTKGEGDVKMQEMAGQDYAVFLHRGPYQDLKGTYEFIYKKWAPTAKRKISQDPVLEIYKNHPEMTPPEQLLTEVCVPLAK